MKREKESLEETEKSLLCCVLSDEVAFEELKSVLEADDFSTETHQLIFKAMESLITKGEPIDHLSLFEELNKNTPRPDGGDWGEFLTNVLDLALPIDIKNLGFHIEKIKEASQSRKIEETSYRLYKAAKKDTEEDRQKLIEKLSELQQDKTDVAFIILSNRKVEPRKWLLEGLFPDRFPSIIYGAGGLGKSYLALYLGILASLGGKRFFGHRLPDEPLNVAIIDYELDADEQTLRAQQISRGLNQPDVPTNLHYLSPTEGLPRFLPKLKTFIKKHNIRLLIIDSLGASGTDGESVQDIVKLYTELRELEIATLVLDHQSKMQAGDSYNNKTPFGSVYKWNLARSVFQLSKEGAKDNRTSLNLRHVKSNFSKHAEELRFDICFEGDRVLFTESTSKTPETKELERIWQVMKEMEDNGLKTNQKTMIKNLEGEIARDRVISLLKKGESEYWDSGPGERNEIVYKSRILKNGILYSQDSRILEDDSENYEFPEEILDEPFNVQ